MLLIAGDSGIVPLAVVAREVLHTEADAQVTLIYGSASLQQPSGPQDILVAAGKTLLEATLDADVPIGFSCCSGGCGACRVHITQHLNNVALDEPNDISAQDRARGDLPACLLRLRGPVSFSIG